MIFLHLHSFLGKFTSVNDGFFQLYFFQLTFGCPGDMRLPAHIETTFVIFQTMTLNIQNWEHTFSNSYISIIAII
ncbi:hypothetical protein HZS_3643 [Henneguya salminicola]|nr:hypothetical protein HZS_3643 [Henneguya salminicola]